MARLVRKQVYLTMEQDRLLHRAALREKRSEAEILRAALDARLRTQHVSGTAVAKDSLWQIVALGTSKRRDVSERVDEVLYGRPK